MVTDSGLSFFKHRDQFRVVVDGSRSRSGDIFLDTDLLTLVAGNNFQKTSNTMVAMVDEKSITNFVNILQNKHHLSITITGQQFKQVEDNVVPLTDRYKPIRLPPPTDDSAERKAAAQDHKKDDQRPTAKIISLLELEAEALELELQLLAA